MKVRFGLRHATLVGTSPARTTRSLGNEVAAGACRGRKRRDAISRLGGVFGGTGERMKVRFGLRHALLVGTSPARTGGNFVTQ